MQIIVKIDAVFVMDPPITGSASHLTPKADTSHVRCLQGKHFTLEVETNDTITAVKGKIQREESLLDASQQCLLFAATEYDVQQLPDDSRVSDYPIRQGSTLKLVLRLVSGECG